MRDVDFFPSTKLLFVLILERPSGVELQFDTMDYLADIHTADLIAGKGMPSQGNNSFESLPSIVPAKFGSLMAINFPHGSTGDLPLCSSDLVRRPSRQDLRPRFQGLQHH